jgi:hypothetical protein
VAFGAGVSDIATGGRCALLGEPRVVATHIVPKTGVTAVSKGGRVWLHYATKAKAEETIALEPESLETVEGETPPPAETLEGPADRVEISLNDGRRLIAWTQGSVYSGLKVQAAYLATDGSTEGIVDLGYQGSAIGDPAVAVTSAGNGVVAFIESNGAGFQLVATRVSCKTR